MATAAALLVAAAAGAVGAGGLSLDFHAASCPQLEGIVRGVVQAARAKDVQLTAGLLRIFFHDCLPQGCDASILLDGEKSNGPNSSLQPRALQLIEDVRAKVHAACGPTVSCADIIVLATRDAVSLAGGPSFQVPLGRTDSLRPASDGEIGTLPSPFFDVSTLLDTFRSKGLGDPADLVALSGGHTVGKASCSFIRANDDFSRGLAANCSAGRPGTKQSLDVITPDAFDNRYFVALRKTQGVLFSDQGLARDQRTSGIVSEFANNQSAFFRQFAKSMVKLGSIKGAAAGEIRRNCFRPNNRVNNLRDIVTALIDDTAIVALTRAVALVVALRNRQAGGAACSRVGPPPLPPRRGRGIVGDFANDQQRFFSQFPASMMKLSQLIKAPPRRQV
ncbi:Peroxidase 12 [Dichanthelium oligosanthes]|uniref:Peroxidase n=1 Tax=Dichanthelium oligosanthes TaxID=888268 RepID=A0A1E5VBJ9_9POAL|nr:Peroxidase 12 [Dichanthelium oligosanthes]